MKSRYLSYFLQREEGIRVLKYHSFLQFSKDHLFQYAWMLEKEIRVQLNPVLLFGLVQDSRSAVLPQFVSGGGAEALKGTLSFEMTEV